MAVTKRHQLEVLDAEVARLDILHAEAVSFDGEFRSRLAQINNRLIEVSSQVGIRSGVSQRWPTPSDIAEHAALEEERARTEQGMAGSESGQVRDLERRAHDAERLRALARRRCPGAHVGHQTP